ncbi:SDR family NAD(P)-dependent oxidoreductase [Pseudochelatococcus sp. B33]
MHLTSLLLPRLSAQPQAAIINVSSGLAFLPLKFAAVYVATKAALHAFTMALRADLAGGGVRIVEIVPPAVDTDLGGAGLHTEGVSVDAFADAAMSRLAAGELEIGYGPSDRFRLASRGEIEALLNDLNG